MEQNPYAAPQNPSQPAKQRTRYWALGLAIAGLLYFLSLGGSTLITGTDGKDRGFLIGFVCLLFGQGYLPWYANPLILFSAICLYKNRFGWAAAWATFAFGLSLTALLIPEILIDEAGTTGPVTGYGAGFHLWLGCSLVLLGTSVVCMRQQRSVKIQQATPH
jgi:hypothetical protein